MDDSHGGNPGRAFEAASRQMAADLERIAALHRQYRDGRVHVHVPQALYQREAPLDDLIHDVLPDTNAALEAASRNLFYSLPVAFDPAQSIGPFLATIDCDSSGEPYRFLDMGALIATQAFGENDPAIVEAILTHLPYAVSRYAHSEYQTALSLRLKSELNRIAPTGTPRHFVVNTGAEAVENAIKSVLLNRVKTSNESDGGFIISFDGAFHGRTLGSLAVTHRKKARLGFPTFDWPQVLFPVVDGKAKETARREERSLKQIWDLLVSGRLPHAEKSKEVFRRELDAIDAFLATPGQDAMAFVLAQRTSLTPETIKRSRRVAAVLVEPIQGEGGVRLTTPEFMQRLRLLTSIYDVPLMFDEVQTGWGATGKMWAHELFDLPLPPDVVMWAKKAQNGVLFVSQELATFFQEEKKFNTTWEGDAVGMVRLLAMLDKLDLEQVRCTGVRAREGLAALADAYSGLVQNVRGAGVMLAFDVARADWREALRDRAFRRGLVLLPAGERALRFYPRYDTEPYAIDEALAILKEAVSDIVGGRAEPLPTGPEIRVGALECPLEAIEVLDITSEKFQEYKSQIMEVEIEHYGDIKQYPPDVLREGRRPLLQLPAEMLESTISNPRAIGVALRDGVSGRVVAYGLGSALEDHDEQGVESDPHFGESNTFYLHARAILPSVHNQAEIENQLLEQIRVRALAAAFEYLSVLIEERVYETGPEWLRQAQVIQAVDNYLRSGIRFLYLQLALDKRREPRPLEQRIPLA
ncbi:MAG TPA: aminotransferase class III-fold pyridoxal phosphate-dependent enzyme [Vicinamibacterales bacterium]